MRDIPAKAGIGFTLIVAAATFAVALVAGIFLIWETARASSAQSSGQTPSQISRVTPSTP